MLRVMHLIRVDSIGGAERTIISGVPALRADGIDASVGILDAFDGESHPIVPYLTKSKVPFFLFSDQGRPHISTMVSLLRVLRQLQVDCLHMHGYRAAVYGGVAANMLRIPTLLTRHGVLSRHRRERLVEQFELHWTRFLDGVICVAPHLREGVKTTVFTIPNAVSIPDMSELHETRQSPTRLLYVGRLSDEKNVHFLLRALLPVFSRTKTLHLDIVGDGPLRHVLEDWVEQHQLKACVTFHGFQRQITPFYREADILLMSSLREGLPLVALEAMAEGLPVVATAVGGLPHLLEGVPTRGYTVPLGEISMYTKVVQELLDTPGLACRVGLEGRRYIETTYHLQRWTQAHKQLYRQLVDERTFS